MLCIFTHIYACARSLVLMKFVFVKSTLIFDRKKENLFRQKESQFLKLSSE